MKKNAQSVWANLHPVLFGGIGGGLMVVPYMGAYLSATKSLLVSAFLLVVGGMMTIPRATAADAKSLTTAVRIILSASVIGLVLFLLLKLTHDFFALRQVFSLKISFVEAIQALLLLAYILLIIVMPAGRLWLRIVVLAMAFAVYCGINLVGYKMDAAADQGEGVYEAIGGTLAKRMLAPFGPGLNGFGSLAVFGSQVNLFALWLAWKNRQRLLILLSFLGMLTCGYASYLVQIRSGLLGLMFTTGFLLAPAGLKKWMSLGSVAGLLLLPLAFINLMAVNLLSYIVPERIETLLQRNADEFGFLGGRAFIFDYGWTLLQEGQTGWFGFGILNRDSSPVLPSLAEATMLGGSTSFHNGALDLLVVYGPLLGVLGLFALFLPFLLMLQLRTTVTDSTRDAVLGVFMALCVSSYLEAYTEQNLFWVIAILLAATLFELRSSREFTN